MVKFVGRAHGDGEWSVFIQKDDGQRPLPLRLDVRNHSPTGFAWGYGGSGPSQLALALLLQVTDVRTAIEHYQAFKFAKIARMPIDKGWEMTPDDVKAWLFSAQEKEATRP